MAIMGIKKTKTNGRNKCKAINIQPNKEYVKRIGKIKLTPSKKIERNLDAELNLPKINKKKTSVNTDNLNIKITKSKKNKKK